MVSLRLGADPTLASSKPQRTFAEADAREANLPSGFAGRAGGTLCLQHSEPAQPLPTPTSPWLGSVWDRESSCPPATHHTHPSPSALAQSGPSEPPNKGGLALVSTHCSFLALTGGKPAPLGKDTTPVVGTALPALTHPGEGELSVTCEGILLCS